MKSKKIIILFSFILSIALLALLAYGLTQANQVHTIPTVLKGEKATVFTLTTLDKQKISLSQFQGKPVILNFWASWCVSCREEARILEATYEKWKDKGAVFIGVAINDTPEDAAAFIKKYGKTYLLGLDDEKGSIALNYGVTAVPETFLINEQGVVIDKIIGPVTEKQLDTFLQKHL